MMTRRGSFSRLPDSAFEPLKITAWLQTGIIADAMCPLDGVLYSVAMRERYGHQALTCSGGAHPEAAPGVQLPLKRVNGHEPMWFYASSFAQWSQSVCEGMEFWCCRLDEQFIHLVDFRKKHGHISSSSGAYKAHHMPVFYRHALYIDWYVVGHKPSIERLLRFATHLGKKTAQGFGAVLRWDVESFPHDWSVIGPHGRIMRSIPVECGLAGQRLLYGYRPPYWRRKNQTLCVMPIQPGAKEACDARAND